MTWIEHIKEEQLPEDYQIIVDAIGLENTIKLAKALPACTFLKSPDKLFKPAKVQYILDCYTKAGRTIPLNHRRMALETGLSIRRCTTL